MKKLTAIVLALLLIGAAFTGCGKKNEVPEDEKNSVETDVSTGSEDEKDASEDTEKDESEQNVENEDNGSDEQGEQNGTTSDGSAESTPDSKPADKNNAGDNKQDGADNSADNKPDSSGTPVQPETPPTENSVDLSSKTLSEIVELIYEKQPVELRLMTSELDLSDKDALQYNTGLDSADLIQEAVESGPMIGSIPYSLVLVRVKDSADAEKVAKAMKEGINTSKWVCVTADDLKVSAYEDLVLLFMVGSNYADVVTSQEMMTAFKSVCGGSLSVEL